MSLQQTFYISSFQSQYSITFHKFLNTYRQNLHAKIPTMTATTESVENCEF